MITKPSTSYGYDLATTRHAKATCLYVATKLGDLMDRIVIIGGLVPSLLVPQHPRAAVAEPHVGTMDLDLGLDVELLTTGLYQPLTDRLRAAGFTLDANERGNPTRQRWRPASAYPVSESTSSSSRHCRQTGEGRCATFNPTSPPSSPQDSISPSKTRLRSASPVPRLPANAPPGKSMCATRT